MTVPLGPGRNRPEVSYPARRRLRAFAFDPMSTRLSGRLLDVDVPFELYLQPGPIGELVHVVDYDGTRNKWYEPVNLDDPAVLAAGGLRPAERDPRTHQQIVYAIAMSVLERFERFVGRRFRWRSSRALRLVPHAFEGRNAFFDPDRRAVLFGYYRADRHDPGENLPGQFIFTCLSADIIAHEVTHAIVHRLRRYFSEATNQDVFAFHEAFADLMALFQHFAYRDVVMDAVAANQGDLGESGGLLDLAREFGRSTGRGGALRSAIKVDPTPERFLDATEPHERGACFVAGVFDAYRETYQRRIADLMRIASGGTGVLPLGRLHPDLVSRIADEAVQSADRILGMVVQAFDFLPVVDVTFGDVVRAIVTADRALYPEDRLGLRSRLVEALRARGIYPSWVASLADDALMWPEPVVPLTLAGDLAGVILSATKDLDPEGEAGGSTMVPESADPDGIGSDAAGMGTDEVLAPALVSWAGVHAYELGLEPTASIALAGVHVTYRVASDGQPRPKLIIQFTQRREDLEDAGLAERDRPAIRAGTTLIASVAGKVNFVIAKPLPFRQRELIDDVQRAEVREVAYEYHDAGIVRLAAMRKWFDEVEFNDALSPWTSEPALRRLTFANLHAAVDGRAD